MAAVEGIDIENVTAWVAERIKGLEPPLEFTLIAGGHSNLTYKFVDRRGEAYVLRRPPLGHILESAHDMGAGAPHRLGTCGYRRAGASDLRVVRRQRRQRRPLLPDEIRRRRRAP